MPRIEGEQMRWGERLVPLKVHIHHHRHLTNLGVRFGLEAYLRQGRQQPESACDPRHPDLQPQKERCPCPILRRDSLRLQSFAEETSAIQKQGNRVILGAKYGAGIRVVSAKDMSV